MFESDLTVSKAMNSMSLSKLSKGIEKRNVVKAITYLILRLSDNFNVKQKFTDEQASILALDLTEIFAYETLEDVVLMFKYARQGVIGDSKDFKLDGQTVMQKWVPAYLDIKATERENEHNRQKGKKNGMTGFKWQKEDLEKLNVDNKLTLPVKLGQRMKEKMINVENPVITLKDRKQYLTEMYYQVRKMSDDSLKTYLLKSDATKSNDKSKIPFDEDVYNLVETEIDRRNSLKK